MSSPDSVSQVFSLDEVIIVVLLPITALLLDCNGLARNNGTSQVLFEKLLI